MPGLMRTISTIGTAAMLWVGGSIVVHGLESFGLGAIGHTIEDVARHAAEMVPTAEGAVEWSITAALDGIFGLILDLPCPDSEWPRATAIRKDEAGRRATLKSCSHGRSEANGPARL